MYIAAIIVILLYVLLFALSKAVDYHGERKGIWKIFDSMSAALLFFLKKFGFSSRAGPGIYPVLEQLNPGEDAEKLYEGYLVKKLSLSLLVILAGTFLGAAVKYSAGGESILTDGGLERAEPGGKAVSTELNVELLGQSEAVTVTVYPRELSYEEFEELLPEFFEALLEVVLDENP